MHYGRVYLEFMFVIDFCYIFVIWVKCLMKLGLVCLHGRKLVCVLCNLEDLVLLLCGDYGYGVVDLYF